MSRNEGPRQQPLLCRPLDRLFRVFTEILTSDQSVMSLRVTTQLVATKVLETVYPVKTLICGYSNHYYDVSSLFVIVSFDKLESNSVFVNQLKPRP